MIASLRTKIVLIAASAVLLAIGAITASTGYLHKREYTRALESRSLAIAQNLKAQLERILQLGIKLENLIGFEEQASEIVRAYEGIDYALVTDPNGGILFRSDLPQDKVPVLDAAALTAMRSGLETIVPPGHPAGDYKAVVPVFDLNSNHIAEIVIGFPAHLVDEQVSRMMRLALIVGFGALVAGLALLLAGLRVFVTAPLDKLTGAIAQIRVAGDISLRVSGKASDEIGVLIDHLNGMLDEIEQRALAKLQADDALHHQATHDQLTGLPNRHLLNDRLAQLLAEARRNSQHLAVMFLDLDRFKFINDSFGHSAGDLLLKAVAARLAATMRETDTVARLGGDEFVIVLAGIAQPDYVTHSARRVLAQFEEPFDLEGRALHVGASIGVSLYPNDGDTAEILLRNADAALYRAKDQGRSRVQFYTADVGAHAQERIALEHALRLALPREEFELHYQPKIDLWSGKVQGVEALVRWHSSELGIVPSDTFIPVAEDIGLIAPLGEWVLKTACAQLKAWHTAGLTDLRIAVNLSPRQFGLQDIPALVGNVLEETGVAPQHLELELTESVLMRESDRITDTLRALKAQGLILSLDDFGTGYSSLSYVRRFPIDVIKIDRSFIREITSNPDDAQISRAIIAMAHSLGMQTVAEGVENAGQAELLKKLRCDAVQGYHYSKPLPAAELTHYLLEQQRMTSRNRGPKRAGTCEVSVA